jgi:uncharacterized repeat protein (TIGR03843 family)
MPVVMTADSPFIDRAPMDTDQALELLETATVEVRGRMPYSSNATFLVDLITTDIEAQGIYKPIRGERPLWDFPTGLAHREAAAFEVGAHLGWHLVPPTIVRSDMPLGRGSLQLFIPCEFEQHYFTLREDRAHDLVFQQICAFDFVINNTDRKSGHCLLGTDGRIWAIDNGLSFHEEFKLRTVVWDYEGQELPAEIREDLWSFVDRALPRSVSESLTEREVQALVDRTRALATKGRFPVDDTGRRWPWPLV